MKKRTYLLFIAFLSSFHLFSQEIYIRTIEEFYNKKMVSEGISGKTLDLLNIKGSPYFNNQFQKGEVLTTSNTKYIGIPLRYNIYNNEIEFEGKDKKVYNLEKSTVKSVKIDSTEFIYKTFNIKNHFIRSYYEVLLQGKSILLKQYQVEFEEEKPAKPYQDPVPARFKQPKVDFYITKDYSEVQKISNFKDLSSILSDKTKEMEKYIKTNKLKIGKQEDLLDIVRFYNSLE